MTGYTFKPPTRVISWCSDGETSFWTVGPAVVLPDLPAAPAPIIESESDRIWRLLVLAAES